MPGNPPQPIEKSEIPSATGSRENALAGEARHPGTAPGFSLQQTFTALKYPNYRLWFYGQMASLVGTWMQTTAQGYLIFQLTQSPIYLGYVGFAAGLPSWLLMLYGGVVADRVSRRR